MNRIPPFTRTQEAADTPFDNSVLSWPLSDDNVQEAIEYVKDFAAGSIGFNIQCGFDGNAGVGRWLEFLTNVASDDTPFVLPVDSALKAISIASQAIATVTITIYKNGIALETISLSSQYKNNKTGLSHSLSALDELSIRVTSGSCSRPVMCLLLQSNA